MQTPAEKYNIETLRSYIREYYKKYNDKPRILNIGAGRSLVIENQIANSRFSFVCDRADIRAYQISGNYIGNCYQCSVENMRQNGK